MNWYFILLGVSAFLASVSQVLLKSSAGRKYKNIILEYCNPLVISGYVLLLLTTVINLFANKGVDYKYVPIMESLSFVFVIVFSKLIFHEKITKKKFIGCILIILGIIVFKL